MKNLMKSLILMVSPVPAIAILFAAILAGCGGSNGGGNNQPPPVTAVATCPLTIQMAITSPNYKCTGSVPGTWSVNNTAVATIDAGGVLTPNKATTGAFVVTLTPTGDEKPGTADVAVVDQAIYTVGSVGNVYLVNRDGTGKTPLTTGCAQAELFVDHTGFVCMSVKGNGLLVYSLSGTTATQTATLDWPNIGTEFPSPSPNGKTLLFRAYDVGVKRFGLYKSNMDGSGLKMLSQEDACIGFCVGIEQAHYNYEGAGTKIVYTHVVKGQSMICTMDADGSNQSCLIPGGDGAFDRTGETIYFSALDGTRSVDSTGGTVSGLIIPGGGAAEACPNGSSLIWIDGSGVNTSHTDGSGKLLLGPGGSHGSC